MGSLYAQDRDGRPDAPNRLLYNVRVEDLATCYDERREREGAFSALPPEARLELVGYVRAWLERSQAPMKPLLEEAVASWNGDVKHGSPCPGDCGGTFICSSCNEVRGYCFGSADADFDLCDDCWGKKHGISP